MSSLSGSGNRPFSYADEATLSTVGLMAVARFLAGNLEAMGLESISILIFT